MTQLVVELPSDAYERLRQRADALGKSSAAVAADVLTVWVADPPSAPSQLDMQARATQVLREAGLLVEISPKEKELAKQWTMPLQEIRAALGEAGGQPLSELIIEMRGPKG